MAASRFSTFLESFDADPKTRGTQWEHVCKWFLEAEIGIHQHDAETIMKKLDEIETSQRQQQGR